MLETLQRECDELFALTEQAQQRTKELQAQLEELKTAHSRDALLFPDSGLHTVGDEPWTGWAVG